MIRAPGFWQKDGVLPAVLSPMASVVAGVTARRVARVGWRAPVPVVCVGNVTVGGAGKTIVALDIGARLAARGGAPHFLLRGYGARVREATRVLPAHTAAEVGDEALLLAAVAPTWVSPDRAAGARAAVAAGARAIVMDDGLQNPGLHKDVSLLVIDGTAGFGNGRVLPAGPLREPVAAAAGRCAAAVVIGEDRAGVASVLKIPVLRARLVADGAGWAGVKVLGFAGIGLPGKFFDSLRGVGAEIVGTISFADHHPYSAREIEGLLARAAGLGAVAVTTAKDFVRIPEPLRDQVRVLRVALEWEDTAAIEALLP